MIWPILSSLPSTAIYRSKRHFCFNSSAASTNARKIKSTLEEISTYWLSGIHPQPSRSSSSASTSSYQEVSTPTEKLPVLQVWLLVSQEMKMEMWAYRPELWCLLITESAASMSSTRWSWRIKSPSMRQCNSKPSQLPRQESTPPWMPEQASLLQPTPSSEDTTSQNHSKTTSTSARPSCHVSISFLWSVMSPTNKPTSTLALSSSACIDQRKLPSFPSTIWRPSSSTSVLQGN